MSSIPVLASIISPKYLKDVIISQYGLDKGTECELLRTGMNHTYKIKSKPKDYILRIYSFKWRTRTEIQEELDLLLRLSNLGISVSFPIRNSNMEYLNEIKAPERLRYYVLSRYSSKKIGLV